jgi:hypothetical protein
MRRSLIRQTELQQSIEDELQERKIEHQNAVAMLKSARRKATVKRTPLVLLAQGDSWFDYPLIGNGPLIRDTDIIAQLKLLGAPPPLIQNLAHFGEATTDELSLPKQRRMIESLQDPANWLDSGKPDAILFSGGGNDIAGNQFCIFLNYYASDRQPLNTERFNKALGMLEASYLDLFSFRDKYAPGVPIFAHNYAFPCVTGAHPACAGPWLQPSVEFCGWTGEQGTEMVRQALQEMSYRLQVLADDRANNFVLIDTQQTKLPLELWANELHPQPDGFQLIAEQFLAALRSYPLFKERI